MEISVKKYGELSADEVYDILEARSRVFVVEQQCVYQDIDGWDRVCRHVQLRDGGELVAYARVLPRGTVFDEVSIGRVLSLRRRKGCATQVVKRAIETARDEMGAASILIEAQVYARSLYEKAGFAQVSEEFLEDGIPHIKMRLVF